jgi:DNA-binding XRE family transcriptional regulator
MDTTQLARRPIADHLAAFRVWQVACPIRVWREQHGYTQAALAECLAVAISTVHMWEAGTREPFLSAWIRLAALTGLTLAEWAAWRAARPQLP